MLCIKMVPIQYNIIELSHESNLGSTMMKRNPRMKVWWPKMGKEAEELCRT